MYGADDLAESKKLAYHWDMVDKKWTLENDQS